MQQGSTLRYLRVEGGAVPPAPVPGLLLVFDGKHAMAAPLPLPGHSLELGRGLAVPGAAPDPHLSRRHARVEFDGQHFWVTDLGSRNGTFVHGERLPDGTPRELRDVVRVGDTLFLPCADLAEHQSLGVEIRAGFVRGPAMQRLLQKVAEAACSETSLHVHGESGAGKEEVARAFHRSGPRASGPFIAVNCAAIPQGVAERLLFGAKRGAYSGADVDAPGYLQAAEGGTLFLDEVAELDLQVQAKLLRVLETGEVLALGAAKPKTLSLRICSASNKDLRAQVAAGKLREDLYFRLARPELTLPPLRKRREEVPFLLEHEIQKATLELGLHVSLVEACLLRPWPGNVRELLSEARSAVRAALAQKSAMVERAHLSPSAGTAFRVATTDEALPEPSRPSPPSRPTSDEPIAARGEPGGLASATAHQAPALPPAKAALAPPLYTHKEGGTGPTAARAEGGASDAARALSAAAGKSPDSTPRRGTPRAKPLKLAEKNRIEAALLLMNGKVRAAAKELGLHRTQLRRLIERGQVLTPKPDPDEPPAGREDDAESALGGGG